MDKQSFGWLKQLAARTADAGEFEIARVLQEDAYFANNNLHRPLNTVRYDPVRLPQAQARAVATAFDAFNSKKGFIANFESIVSLLVPGATSNQFEESLASLGRILGFATDRPDNKIGKGPDVLWLLDDTKALVIEAKSTKLLKNPLDKGEHAQLLEAHEWFKTTYPGYDSVRVSMHPSRYVRYEPSAKDTKVLTFEKLNELVIATRLMLLALDRSLLKNEELELKCEELLDTFDLTPNKLPITFLETFIEREEL